MLIFIGIAFINGVINIINKMINLQAKLKLGMANGTLINYLEGTFISLLIVAVMGKSRLTNLEYLKSIPFLCFLGGFFGLLSMILILLGMSKNQISYSTIIVLVGQLGAGLLIDSIVALKVAPLKIAGIILVILGVVLDKYLFRKSTGNAPV
jgi:Uncharacterized protein conserved in bacteria